MTASQDPTDAIRRQAVTFPGVAKGSACNQSAFKAGKGTFLFIGPGPRQCCASHVVPRLEPLVIHPHRTGNPGGHEANALTKARYGN